MTGTFMTFEERMKKMNVASQKNVRPTSLDGVSLTVIFCRASVTPERANASSTLKSLDDPDDEQLDEPGQAEADEEDHDPGEEAGQEGHELLDDLPQRFDDDLVEEIFMSPWPCLPPALDEISFSPSRRTRQSSSSRPSTSSAPKAQVSMTKEATLPR